MRAYWSRQVTFWILIGTAAGAVYGQDEDLAGYFGFEGLEVVKIGRKAGPMACVDMNGDGLKDLLVVNNHASRIELHYQKPDASADDTVKAPSHINEFPEHWRFERQFVSVTHEVAAITPHDFDGDGRMDLVYAGRPGELVFVRQTAAGRFEAGRRHRVKKLAAARGALAVADLIADCRPELLSIVDGSIMIWPLEGDSIAQPVELAAGEKFVAFLLEDYNGDGRRDIAGVIPDDRSPIRIWFAGEEEGGGVLGPQILCEMPPLIEGEAVRLPGEAAARLAVIERASKRIVVYAITSEPIEEAGDRDAAMRVYSFTDAGNRDRDHAVVDADGDGLLDLVATDTEGNALVVYPQLPGKGLAAGQSYPSLSELSYLSAGNVDDDRFAELFVLSEKEGVVGRCDVSVQGVPFPRPLNISAGRTPTALGLVRLEKGPCVAVVAKESRDYVVDLIDMEGHAETIELGKLSKSPETLLALDADQDGRTDILLFTRDKPMIMLHATGEGFAVTESKDMGQYGLVKAAQAENIAVFDIDGDGREELLIADQNFVRAVRYERDPGAGISPGWQVVEQINADDSSSKLVSLALLSDRIVAADKENDRLAVMAPSGAGGGWSEIESLTVGGFSFRSIHAGAFSGDGQDNILAVGDEGFAIIRLAGERIALEEVASWRTTEERRRQHELACGDVNGDGFLDMVALDAGEQMCEIFTFTASGRMLYAASFQVFESRLFSGGEPREYQPSQAIIADVTGDGADDLILLAHDRVLLYPQMTESAAR